jgi:small subunit ribosomal protein S6
VRYEILLLAIPEITGDEASRLESQLRDSIREKKGTCISFERWGKFRLLYPVNKNEYGVYFLVRLEAGTSEVIELLKQVRALIQLKYNEIVMRYLINKLDKHDSLAYQRPESLEEAPGKVADSLGREHKVDFGSEDRGRDLRNEAFEGDSSEESTWQRK